MVGHWTTTTPMHDGRFLAVLRGRVVIVDVHITYDDEAQPLVPNLWLRHPDSGLSREIDPEQFSAWWSTALPRPPI